MRKLISLALLIVVISCSQDNVEPDQGNCGVEATVRDLTGLDGCGFVFELRDGTRLEPFRLLFCGTPPLPKEVTEDPLFNFRFIDGKKVRIGYEEVNSYVSICVVGKLVRITCLEEVEVTSEK